MTRSPLFLFYAQRGQRDHLTLITYSAVKETERKEEREGEREGEGEGERGREQWGLSEVT